MSYSYLQIAYGGFVGFVVISTIQSNLHSYSNHSIEINVKKHIKTKYGDKYNTKVFLPMYRHTIDKQLVESGLLYDLRQSVKTFTSTWNFKKDYYFTSMNETQGGDYGYSKFIMQVITN
jgi:hypothetical protein